MAQHTDDTRSYEERREELAALVHYEGLIAKTAQLLHGENGIEFYELDDLKQAYALKVLQALRSFDPAKLRSRNSPHRNTPTCRCARCRYVFQCVCNLTKDLKQRKRRGERFIDDLCTSSPDFDTRTGGLPSRDSWEAQHLAADHDLVYAEVEVDSVQLPNTLAAGERDVVVHLYAGYKMTEIMRLLKIGRNEYDARMAGIEAKLSDWRPGPAAVPELAA